MAGEVLNRRAEMAEVPALPAASALVMRDAPLEVLMMRRHEKSSFVPNAWVFPGGVLEQSDRELAREVGDGSLLTAMRIAAARETFEETGVWLGAPLEDAEAKRRRLLAGRISIRHLLDEGALDLERLVWTSRWITPTAVPKRFDTYFFLTVVTRDVVATAEQTEAVEVTWIAPSDALARHADGAMEMVFPTLRNLEAIESFETASALIESRRGATIEPVQPVIVDGRITLP